MDATFPVKYREMLPEGHCKRAVEIISRPLIYITGKPGGVTVPTGRFLPAPGNIMPEDWCFRQWLQLNRKIEQLWKSF